MTGPSPYVRRQWLAKQIRDLRLEHDYSMERLARRLGFSMKALSALENGRKGPDIDLVSGICEYFQIGIRRRDAIMAAATDGWATGWWEADAARIGRRQSDYADWESGARTAEYGFALIPGRLQTPEFAYARMRSDPALHTDEFDPTAAVAARAHRQRLLLAADGPAYELVLDEFAVRRCAADASIVAAQLRHIVAVCAAHPSIVVRILPLDAAITSHTAPRSAYSIYRYSDQDATVAVAVDTLTTDLILTDPAEVEAYRGLHSRLKAAALTPQASLEMLTEAAHQLSPIRKTHDREAVHEVA
jgi:transcriptional regulator with XRE-family HTH domain